jgi:hypothetical protein
MTFVYESRVLKSHTIIALRFLCAFMYSSVCFIRLDVPMFEHMFTIVISSWWVVPFINMKWPSFSLLNNLDLKPALSYTSITYPVCFQDPFAWKIFFYPFTFCLCLSLPVKHVSCRQQMGRCHFFNMTYQSLSFDWRIKTMKFRVIIERYVVIPAILLFL